MPRSKHFTLAAVLWAAAAGAQEERAAPPEAPVAMFPHGESSRFLASGQVNIIFQAHPPFHSPYAGVNSLTSRGEYKTSLIGTLFLGAELVRDPRLHTDVILDFESAGGRGISQALGLAGFTNLDVVRNPNLGSKPYLSRVQVHETIGLGGKLVDGSRTPFALATRVPERRLDLRVGKMSLPDVMDQNSVGSDSHFQFTNWTIDNNGAWDYAADTRGYTWAMVAELDDRSYTIRYALATMPTVANGIDVDFALRRASGQNVEFESRRPLLKDRRTAVRLLGYVNHANMGTYRTANHVALLTGAVPNVVATRRQGTVKYGFGLNAEQELGHGVRAYTRWGWNEGQHESFAYTEVDETVSAGADYQPAAWGRPKDRMGVAFVSNAIKRDHQMYLELGGLGFLLGDGRLRYAREDTTEMYYNAHAWRGLFLGVGGSVVAHPGYNQDRGPVLVPSVRTHVEF